MEATPEEQPTNQTTSLQLEDLFQKEGKYLNKDQIETLMEKKAHLTPQTYDDIPSLHPLSQCVMSRQATINIGTIGHVSHGKTTVVKAVSGVHTIKFGDEKRRNITIR